MICVFGFKLIRMLHLFGTEKYVFPVHNYHARKQMIQYVAYTIILLLVLL